MDPLSFPHVEQARQSPGIPPLHDARIMLQNFRRHPVLGHGAISHQINDHRCSASDVGFPGVFWRI